MTTKQKTIRRKMIENLARWLNWTIEETANDVKHMGDAELMERYQRLQRAYGLPAV